MKKILLLSTMCALWSHAQSQSWNLIGNGSTDPTVNFIGTTDSKAFKIRTNNVNRINITNGGKVALGNFTPTFKLDVKGSINTDSVYRIGGNTVLSVKGAGNTFVGTYSGFHNNTGNYNTAIGANSLYSNTAGYQNVAAGYHALYSNTSGGHNCAYGYYALRNNTTGIANTACGTFTLYANVTGHDNTAYGANALYNDAGSFNTATGSQSLFNNTLGAENTANGFFTLEDNTTGSYNTAIGAYSMKDNTIGQRNTASGHGALNFNTTGNNNTAIGYFAGCNNLTAPSNFTALGYNAGHVNSDTNSVEIGNTSVQWIGGQVAWSTFSDRRIKDNIQENVPGLLFINKLRPVTYNINIHRENKICGIIDSIEWKGKYDLEKISQTGFIAQEVEKAAQESGYNFSGVQKPANPAELYSIRYSDFVMPLVKAVQELQSEIESLKSEINYLKSDLRKSENNQLQSGLLLQNAPNPFNLETQVDFRLPAKFNSALLIITDESGKQIRIYNLQQSTPVIIKKGELSAGIYSYSLIIDGITVDARQMMLTK